MIQTIGREDRSRVFERFTRLDDARARDAGGTGLGLAIVRQIVDRHHGQIDLAGRTGRRHDRDGEAAVVTMKRR